MLKEAHFIIQKIEYKETQSLHLLAQEKNVCVCDYAPLC